VSNNLDTLAALLRLSLPTELQGQESVKVALNMPSSQIYQLADYACQLADQGSLKDAEAILAGLTVIDPENSYLHSCLGTLYMRQGNNAEAIAELQYCLQLDAQDVAAATNLGELYFEQGKLELAEKYLQQAVALDPEEKNLSANRARALLTLRANVEA
jgi:Flp pilus assembly protein TadD